jgi:hypothetical protein
MGLYKTALQNLKAARKLVTKHWTTGELAIDCKGNECKPKSPKAVSFCALGAVQRINGPGERAAVTILAAAAAKWLKSRKKKTYGDTDDIFEVNDTYGQKAAIQMFDRAIRLARK